MSILLLDGYLMFWVIIDMIKVMYYILKGNYNLMVRLYIYSIGLKSWNMKINV